MMKCEMNTENISFSPQFHRQGAVKYHNLSFSSYLRRSTRQLKIDCVASV